MRTLVDFMRPLDRDLARLLIDIFTVRKLLLDDVDLRDVLQPAGPFAGPQADDATYDLGDALQHHQRTGDGDHGFEVINRRPICRHIRMLPHPPRVPRAVKAVIYERGHT